MTPAEYRVAPHPLAGPHLEGVDGPVGPAGDDQPLAVDDRHDRVRIVGAVQVERGFPPPDHLAGVLVERNEPAGPAGERAPRPLGHADDHQAGVADRPGHPPAVPRDPPVLLGELVLPHRLARFPVEADEEPGRGVGVNLLGLRVGRHRGPAEPAGHDVGQEHGEPPLPGDLARVGVHADDPLAGDQLLGLGLDAGDVPGGGDHVHLPAHDDRGGPVADRGLPDQVVPAGLVRLPGVGQPGVAGVPGLLGPAPVDPVAGLCRPAEEGERGQGEQPEEAS